jgi:hypothetical protein
MKFRVLALILTLVLSMSMTGWAQDAPATSATPNSTPAPKAEGCCHHDMADMKDGKGCCHQAAADAKDAMSCCGKDKNKCEAKDGKSCCSGKDMKAAMKECKKGGCCKDGESCGEAKGDKMSMDCCGSKCEHHPAAAAS